MCFQKTDNDLWIQALSFPSQLMHWNITDSSWRSVSKLSLKFVFNFHRITRAICFDLWCWALFYCIDCGAYMNSSWNHSLSVHLSVLSQVAVFMYYGFQLDRLVLQVSSPSFLKSPLPYHPQLRAQAWRYLSYIFMHTGYVQILLLHF